MAVELWANNARSSLAAAITDSDTSFSVAAGQGSRFPNPTGGDYFWATIDNGSVLEIVKVTARSTDAFTVVRAQQSTTARGWNIGTRIEIRITRTTLETLQGVGVASDLIWDTKGDLAVGTGANTAAKLAAGADGKVLTTDAAETTGLKWATPGGGDSTNTSAYASRPAASNDGNLFLPSDSFFIERDTGAAFESWAPIFRVKPKSSSVFTGWFNQGSAALDDTYGGTFLTLPATATTQFRGPTIAKTAPYTITALIQPHHFPGNFVRVGLFWTDGTKAASFGVSFNTSIAGSCGMFSTKWTNSTTISADYLHPAFTPYGPLFLQISDDNTNRICRFSHNRRNWVVFHTVTRTDFLTPTHVGFGGDIENNVGGGVLLLDWEET